MKDKESKKAATSIDRHVGERLRMRRVMTGKSQTELAAALGITFQQVQKYEKGANRISPGKLVLAGRFLDAAPTFFFEGAPGQKGATRDDGAALAAKFFGASGGATLASYYLRLPTARRKQLLDLAATLAAPVADAA